MNDMPVVPVYYMENAYLCNKKFKNLDVDYFGHTVFTKAKDKTYKGGIAEAAYVPVKYWMFF
jgi:hypothetical protein